MLKVALFQVELKIPKAKLKAIMTFISVAAILLSANPRAEELYTSKMVLPLVMKTHIWFYAISQTAMLVEEKVMQFHADLTN